MKYGAKQSDSGIRVRRSIARLLSLADMVERSCFQFVLIRVFLLWLLRPADLRVRQHVFDLAGDMGLTELPLGFDAFHAADSGQIPHNSTDEALDMALRLRALAGLWAWLFGLEATRARIGDAFFWANYWRHMRWLANAAQTQALLQIVADSSHALTFERPEVRAGLAPGFS